MKWLATVAVFAPAFAMAVDCNLLSKTMTSLEKDLQNSYLSNCSQINKSALGLDFADTDTAAKTLKMAQCSSLGGIETMLAGREAQLAMLDGLGDLRAQAVAGKRTLQQAQNWTVPQRDIARQFTRDVTLAAAIQQLVENDQLAQLFNDNTSSGGWQAKLTGFCSGQTASAATKFCATWKSQGPLSEKKGINVGDLSAFLDDLRPMLTGGKLDDSKKSDLLHSLRIERNGQLTSFASYRDELEAADMYASLSPTGISRLNAKQVKFIRQDTLRIPDDKDNMNSLKELNRRLSGIQDMLKLKSAASYMSDTMADSTNRMAARLKSRWSALYLKLKNDDLASAPCTDKSAGEFVNCIKASWDALGPNTLARATESDLNFMRYLQESGMLLKNLSAQADRCQREDVLQALVAGTVVPTECNEDQTMSRSGVELDRQILLKLRQRFVDEKKSLLKLRDAGAKAYKQSCGPQEDSFAASSKCLGAPGQVEFGPAIQLITNAMPIFYDNFAAGEELSTNDCPVGDTGPYSPICNAAFNRGGDTTSVTSDPNPRVTPTTLPTDAPKRKSDPIVADTLAKVANEIASTWANNRMNQMMQPNYQWTMPTYRTMPYSQPISLSMSDYVMATSTYYGGYGQYYQCSTCGFGTSPTAFNSFWGTGSASTGVAGMSSGIGGTSLSSRFFGGSSSAGFVSF